tara:strand:+ start:974 stop:1903 length:930 start_codon:yes stop_codon:yes gene_type:complete
MIKINNCPVCGSSSTNSFIKTSPQMYHNDELFNFDKCNNCDFVFLNPRLQVDNLKNYYTSYYLPYRGAKAWGKFEKFVSLSQKNLDLKRVKLIKDIQHLSEESLILDVGCGKPTFLKACQQKLNCKTIGIDFNDAGWKNQLHNFKKINLLVGEIKDLPSNLCPDVITMWHYLEHDYNPIESLKSLKKISKPSTKLVIEVPNFDSLSRKKYGKNWAGWHTPRHLSLFSPKNIKLLLKKTGWNVSEVFTYGTMNPYLLYWMSEMEKKGIRWDKSMENEFISFVIGMIKFLPVRFNEKKSSLGIMTITANPK